MSPRLLIILTILGLCTAFVYNQARERRRLRAEAAMVSLLCDTEVVPVTLNLIKKAPRKTASGSKIGFDRNSQHRERLFDLVQLIEVQFANHPESRDAVRDVSAQSSLIRDEFAERATSHALQTCPKKISQREIAVGAIQLTLTYFERTP